MPRKKATPYTTALALIDTIADVVAHRVVTQMMDMQKDPPIPERVPLWVKGTHEPYDLPDQDKWEGDNLIRSWGGIKYGEPGYDEGLQRHLRKQRERQTAERAEEQRRKAARLLSRFVATKPA